MRKSYLLSTAAMLCLIAAPGHAFGLRTHLYMAEQVFADLQDCKVELVGTFGREVVDVPESVCLPIKNNKGAFLAGAIGPDAFPDLIVGQSFVHPGTKDGRQTGDWLEMLLARAETDAEIAFAYGNMMHAAGDMFAHSYVNNYAGGVFEITAFRAKDIERRHTQLEKYIDQRLNYSPPLDDLIVPTEFLVNAMVRTSYVPMGQSFGAEDLRRLFKSPYSELGRILGTKMKASAPGAHMMMMWGMLAVAEKEQRISPCKEFAAVREMTDALRRYAHAEHSARQADLAARGLQPLTELRLPQSSDIKCEEPRKDELRGYPSDHRPPIAADAALKLSEAEHDQLVQAAAMRIDDFVANRRKTWWDSLKHAQRKPLLDAYIAFENSIEKRKEARALRTFSDYWADDVRMALERYMDASLKTARDMVRSSAPYPSADPEHASGPVHYERWFDCYKPTFSGDPVQAAQERCDRAEALQMSMSLAKAARLAGIGEFNRNLLYTILSFQKWLEEAMTNALFGVGRVVAPSMTELVTTLTEPTRIGRDDLDRSFARGANGQVKFKCVSDWIDADLGMLSKWQGPGYRPNAPCAKDRDGNFLERTSDHLIPEQFLPLQYAIQMGKLALLDQSGVKQLARKLAPHVTDEVITGAQPRYSVIIDTAQSLDGSYQWNGASMPYPRQHGYAKRPATYESAGYPLRREPKIRITFDMEIKRRPGFPYYRTDALRQEVFSQLFPTPFEGEILKANQFNGSKYPFQPCKHDPFRKEHGGSGPFLVCETTKDWIPDELKGVPGRASARPGEPET